MDDPRRILEAGLALRDAGQLDDAVAVLAEGAIAYPDHPALRCYLALALHAAGHRAAALAALLDVVLELADGALDGHEAALQDAHAALLDQATR